MPQTCVVAVCDSFEIATNAVQLLEDINFPPDQVSLVTHRVQELPLQETAKQISRCCMGLNSTCGCTQWPVRKRNWKSLSDHSVLIG